MKIFKFFSKIKLLVVSFFLLVLFSINPTYGETGNSVSEISKGISGKVIDADDSGLIPYATVALFKEAESSLVTGTITNDSGVFLLEQVPSGNYFLEVNFMGYTKTIIEDITIDNKTKSLDLGPVFLKKAYELLNEVEITAEKSAMEYRVDKKVLNIDKNLQSAGGTVIEALENNPSINLDAEGNVLLRGSSSFIVLIDGKPSPLSGSEALRQIPASAVEKIEIITNPSAKYDPDGTAGIINIVMKKNHTDGFNSLLNLAAGTSWKRSGDFAVNYRKNKFNYFLSGRYAERPRYPHTEIINETDFENSTRYVYQYTERQENNNPYAISGGVDYYLDNGNMITLNGEFGHWGNTLLMDADVNEITKPNDLEFFKNTISTLLIGGQYVNGSLYYDHDVSEDSKLVSSVYVSKWDGGNSTEINDHVTDEAGQTIINTDYYKTTNKSDNYELRFKSDYTKSFTEQFKFEAGYQYRLKDETNAFKKFDYNNEQDIWNENPDFSNNILYDRHIHSLYSTFNGEVKGFQYQAGLRAEYTDRMMFAGQDYKYDKINLFPTVHISKPLPHNQQLQLSYSRRINRPEIWLLNPLEVYSDAYLAQSGNPGLLPEFTNSYELNYMKYNKLGFISGEAYYRQNYNSFSQNISLMDDGRTLINHENIDETLAYGVELSSNMSLAKYLSLYATANIFNYTINTENSYRDADMSTLRYNLMLNANVIPVKGTRFQLTGFYNSPGITHQGTSNAIFGMNVALSQELFEKQLNITLSVRDVFKTMVYSFEAFDEGSSTNFTYNMEQQIVMLTLSYKINNYQNRRKEDDATPQGGGGLL
ncbi:MAG: TonB-dependent receptor domain-containing protein [Bacteroidota bacterium]